MELTRRRVAPGRAPRTAREYHCALQGGDLAPGAARRAFDAFVDGELDARSRDACRLMVSELVTNSVRHGDAGPGQRVEVDFTCTDRAVRVAVHDHGPGFDAATARQPRSAHRSGGRGLFLVDRLADRWGVQHNGGTQVWFEIAY